MGARSIVTGFLQYGDSADFWDRLVCRRLTIGCFDRNCNTYFGGSDRKPPGRRLQALGILAGDNYWVIESGAAAYALGVDETGLLLQTWWGPRLPRLADYPKAQRGDAFSMENPLTHTHQDIATG